MKYNIKDFGAVGDGRNKDTCALNKAIAAAAKQHGTVIMPPGKYLCGSINLLSGVTLEIQKNAVLLASLDINDYCSPDRWSRLSKDSLRYYFLGAFDAEDIVICGEGTIDGNGEAFWHDEYFSHFTPSPHFEQPRIFGPFRKPKADRPILIALEKCRNIRVEKLKIVNSASYTIWPLGCDNIRIENLVIRNPRNGPNTDALDIDCCSNVFICGCDIDAGDDCIALKADTHRLGHEKACERVVVSNCILSSATCAVRAGYEGGTIRDCVFSNLVIYDSKNGLDFLAVVPTGKRFNIDEGSKISNMVFSNVVMRNVARPFFLWAGSEDDSDEFYGFIRNIIFKDMVIEAVDSSFVGGKLPGMISDIRFSDIIYRAVLRPDAHPGDEFKFPGVWGGSSPNAFDLVNVPDIVFENFRMIDISGFPGKELSSVCN